MPSPTGLLDRVRAVGRAAFAAVPRLNRVRHRASDHGPLASLLGPVRSRTGRTRAGLAGPWRVAVAEASMVPAIEPGDWLLVDPTIRRWPRRGAIVVFHEPGSDLLVIKRVAGRPGDRVATGQGTLLLDADEGWLVGDAANSHDSRHYGPVAAERLAGRVWFRYGPLRRIGLV